MASSVLRDLLERSDRAGLASPHAERLRARVQSLRGYGDLQTELLAEMASALGRAGDKVDAAILECQLLAREVEAGAPGALERYEAKRKEAAAALRDLTIHREALGLYRNERLLEEYPIPPTLRPRPAS